MKAMLFAEEKWDCKPCINKSIDRERTECDHTQRQNHTKVELQIENEIIENYYILWHISLEKPIYSDWSEMSCFSCSVFSCVYCFFLKTMKLYKDICSAWMSRTSAEIFFSQIDAINVSKIQYVYCYFAENFSIAFRKVHQENGVFCRFSYFFVIWLISANGFGPNIDKKNSQIVAVSQ